jgi:hypothetical protein
MSEKLVLFATSDEDRVNLRVCPQAQTLPQSLLQSVPSSKYLCADTLA